MLYKIFFVFMVVGYGGLAIQGVGLRQKILGIILLIANMLIFWK